MTSASDDEDADEDADDDEDVNDEKARQQTLVRKEQEKGIRGTFVRLLSCMQQKRSAVGELRA